MTDPAGWARRAADLERPLLIALDVDGTLAPIVRDPAAARVPPATLEALARIADTKRIALALVTGRDAAALARVAPLEGVYRAVEHGRVVLAPHEVPSPPALAPDARAALDAFAEEARRRWAPRGAELEPKATSLGVHVRRLAEREPSIADAILEEAASHARALGLHPRFGRAVLEAEVFEAHKGAALAKLEARTDAAAVVYVGDDLTDIPAIRRAAERGLGLFVCSSERPDPPEGASGALEGSGAVVEFLRALADVLSET